MKNGGCEEGRQLDDYHSLENKYQLHGLTFQTYRAIQVAWGHIGE